MIEIISEDRRTELPIGPQPGGALWLSPPDAERATGWTLKPEGLCHGDTCVPVPPARRGELVGDRGVNIAEFWRYMGHPVARDDRGEVWVLGTSAEQRASALQSLQAPDFSLPDVAGRQHTLSDYRGKKVFLATWASW